MSIYRGNTDFRTVSTVPTRNRTGLDALRVVRRGNRNDLATEEALWTRGVSGVSLGYPTMFLETATSNDTGNFATVELVFLGFLSTSTDNPVSVTDNISLAAGSFTPDEPDDDGRTITVQAKYYAQSTTYRWIHYGNFSPGTPRYPRFVPSQVPTNVLFDHFPATYNGTLQVAYVGRLTQFSRDELATGVWGVVETWTNRIEPSG